MAILRMNVDIEEIITKIIRETKKEKKEVLTRIEAKKEDLGGLITDEGAACIVAKELGVEIFEEITFKRKKLQIKDLTIGMNAVSVIGRINSILPIREFTRKNGQKGKYAKFLLEDATGQALVVLWGDQTNLVSEGKLIEESIIELKNAYVKEGLNNQLEVHLGRRGTINLNPEGIDLADFKNSSPSGDLTKINELRVPMWNVNLIGKVRWKSRITTFSKKTGSGSVASLNIADETGQTRIALWDAHASFVEYIEINDFIRITNAYTREGQNDLIEVHIGRKSTIRKEENPPFDLSDEAVNTSSVNEVKVSDLSSQHKNLRVIGKILQKSDVREVNFKNDNSTHQVCNALFADETGTISLSVWDNDIPLIQEGKTYCIENGYVSTFRGSIQLNVGKFGMIKEINKIIKRINRKNNLSEQIQEIKRKAIVDIEDNETLELFGTIVSLQEKKPIYDSCPNCKKKVRFENSEWNCKKCGSISESVPRMLWSFTLDDGTDNIRVTVIDTIAEELLGMSTSEALQMIADELIEHIPLESRRKDLEGKKIIVKGRIRYNSFTSKLELLANNISYPNPCEELTKILQRVESYI